MGGSDQCTNPTHAGQGGTAADTLFNQYHPKRNKQFMIKVLGED